ncbi:MAG: dihydrolipoyllysine-residue succinyltransferase, partial [Pseudomonadota bacterium]
MVEIRVPALGESVTEATIGQWLKKEGDSVSADEPVVELETDKVSVEVPAPAAGVLSKITAKEGDTVELDALLGEIGEANGAAPAPSNGAAASAPAPAAASSEGGERVEITAPSSGESVTEADIGEWLVKVGDFVKVDDPVVSLETDKAAVDVPAPVSGTLVEVKANEGDTVSVGDVLGVLVAGEGAAAPAPQAAATPAPVAVASAETPLSPAPRRIVEQNNLDTSAIAGTGKGGRITKGDALEALSQVGTPAAKPAQARPSAPKELGEREERVKMSRLRQTIARRLKESQEIAAQLTTFNDVDMTGVMEARKQYKELFEKKHGVKLGFMSFFVKACIQALREVPEVNAEIDATDIIYKNHYDVGIAVGTDKGLVVPVLRDADMKSIAQIEKEIADFGRRARDGELKLEEMQGGTFTITNGGVYGSLMSTPI